MRTWLALGSSATGEKKSQEDLEAEYSLSSRNKPLPPIYVSLTKMVAVVRTNQEFRSNGG
jgi:hypothetical protein